MNRIHLPLLAAVATAALSLGACVPDGSNQFLYILGNTQVTNDCSFTATSTGPFRARGTLDVLLTDQYQFSASVQNAMPSTISLQDRALSDPRLEGNIIQLERLEVKYEYPQDPAIFQELENTDATHSDFLGTTILADSVGALNIPLIKPGLAQKMFDTLPPRDETNPSPTVTLVTKITMFGAMLDGTPVETDEFLFPIDVCKGCLLFFPLDAKLGAGNPNCRNEENRVSLNNRCQLGQDRDVDCRICRELKPIALQNQCEPF